MQTTCALDPVVEREHAPRRGQGEARPDDRVVALVPAAELDCFTGLALTAAVEHTAEQRPGANIEVDLSGVQFIDAGGLRALLRCREVSERHCCGITFVDPSPGVVRLAGLLDALRMLFGER